MQNYQFIINSNTLKIKKLKITYNLTHFKILSVIINLKLLGKTYYYL
ncbi:hypothetical protein CHRYSEO8AT_10024 [Chryseobacterium sp. 8AT]|nr:hypothetical protein CHRYSEO8AT_10024 [Chryseobacterium sp. 8AT]